MIINNMTFCWTFFVDKSRKTSRKFSIKIIMLVMKCKTFLWIFNQKVNYEIWKNSNSYKYMAQKDKWFSIIVSQLFTQRFCKNYYVPMIISLLVRYTNKIKLIFLKIFFKLKI